MPAAQARAIVQAIEIEITGAKDTLATKSDLLALRQDFTELRHEVSERVSELRIEIHATSVSNLRHRYAAISAQFALLLGIAYFFVSHIQH